MEQPTLFEGYRQTMTGGIEKTAQSLNTFATIFDDWVVCFSGGKDSSCVATLVPQLIDNGNVPRPKSLRFLYADTRMELPPLRNAAMGVFDVLRAKGYQCDVVLPEMNDRFFVYMFGRGVPPPSNTFRWCTSQIKIEPMMKALKALREKNGKKFLMLTGVRVGESAARDARIALKLPRNRLRKRGRELRKDGKMVANPNRMGPLTLEARRWGLAQVKAIQNEVNAARPACDPEYLLIDSEEEAAIEQMIAGQVWPNGWSGDEGRADLPFEEIRKDGMTQEHLFEDATPCCQCGV